MVAFRGSTVSVKLGANHSIYRFEKAARPARRTSARGGE
jgi:hypothetical protein